MSRESSAIDREIQVINIGIERFADDLREVDVPVIQMDWRPPAGGDRRLIELLDSIAEENGPRERQGKQD